VPPPDLVSDANGDGVADVDVDGDGQPDEDLNLDGVPDAPTGNGLMGFPLSPTQDPALVITTTVLPTFAPQPGYTDVSGSDTNSAQTDGNWRAQDKTAVDAVHCDCANCTGKLYESDNRPGARGYQCKPNAYGMSGGTCIQAGNPDDWVVQMRAELTYERFCMFTCKPLIPKRITMEIPCAPLDKWERTLEAQTPSGNGREFVFRANPMTQAVPWPADSDDDDDNKGPKDPVAQLVATFALYGGGSDKKETPPAGDDEPCECACDVEYKSPREVAQELAEWNAAVSPGALYPTPEPTMPPPPPMPLPRVVQPPLPPPPPPMPSAVAPLPLLPMEFPLPSLQAAPTLEPPLMPTLQPTPPPPAMPPPPETTEPPASAPQSATGWSGAPPGAPPAAPPAAPPSVFGGLFSGMQTQQAPMLPPYMAYGPEPMQGAYWGAQGVPMPPPAPPALSELPPSLYGPPPGAMAASTGLLGQAPSLLQEGGRPMRFTRPEAQASPLPLKPTACPAEQCRSRCAATKLGKERQASMWDAERSAVQKARLRSMRRPAEDDPDDDV